MKCQPVMNLVDSLAIVSWLWYKCEVMTLPQYSDAWYYLLTFLGEGPWSYLGNTIRILSLVNAESYPGALVWTNQCSCVCHMFTSLSTIAWAVRGQASLWKRYSTFCIQSDSKCSWFLIMKIIAFPLADKSIQLYDLVPFNILQLKSNGRTFFLLGAIA